MTLTEPIHDPEEAEYHALRPYLPQPGDRVLDIGCGDAIQEALDKGWFQPETKGRFEYTYYWDTVDEMHEYLEAEWIKSATVPDAVLAQAHRLVQSAAQPVQIRIRRTMVLASYRKLALT